MALQALARFKKVRMLAAYLAILVSGTTVAFDSTKTFLLPRPTSTNAALEIAGWQKEINLFDMGRHYWSITATPTYSHSFNSCALAQYILGDNLFLFQGSRVPNRKSRAILADYFGLPADFESVVCFKPRIVNFMFDINFYMGLDSLLCGLYFRIHAPLGHAKWDLGLKELVTQPGSVGFPAGYMGPETIARNDLASSVTLAMRGERGIPLDSDEGDEETFVVGNLREPFTFGDMQSPLEYGKIKGRQTMTRLSDVQFVLGWNFLQDEWYHVGFNGRGSIPSGNRSRAEYLFEPIVGNGHHWEVGAGLTSHVDILENEACQERVALYLDVNVTHLFSSCQNRSFEFKNNGPGSGCRLRQRFQPIAEDLFLGAGGPLAPNQYAGDLVPAINETTFASHISIPFMIDGVFKVALYRGGTGLDIGYNFWMRSKERLHCRQRLAPNLALKGDAQVYGFDLITDAPVALGATQQAATVRSGQGVTNFVAGSEYANDNADSPIEATNPGPLVQLTTADSVTFGIPQVLVNTSNPSVLLTDADIDNDSALAPKTITHKLFAHLGHRWQDDCDLSPFLGIGADIEWGQKRKCRRESDAVSQWGIWLKGGVSY